MSGAFLAVGLRDRRLGGGLVVDDLERRLVGARRRELGRLGALREPRALGLGRRGRGLGLGRELRGVDHLDHRLARRRVELGDLRLLALALGRGLLGVAGDRVGIVRSMIIGSATRSSAPTSSTSSSSTSTSSSSALSRSGQDRAEHVGAEPRGRDRGDLAATSDRGAGGADRAQHLAHAQGGGHDHRDDQADAREQRRPGRADHRAQDLGEVLADRAARAVARDPVARATRCASVASETTPTVDPIVTRAGITGFALEQRPDRCDAISAISG